MDMNKTARQLAEQAVKRARESLHAPSRFDDPDDAYVRISSQIYNGGMEQLIDNEGGDFEAVAALIQQAGQIAAAVPEWDQASEIMDKMLKILSDGRNEVDEYGNVVDSDGNPADDTYTDETQAAVDKMYGPLVDLLAIIDKALGLGDESEAAGNPFGIK